MKIDSVFENTFITSLQCLKIIFTIFNTKFYNFPMCYSYKVYETWKVQLSHVYHYILLYQKTGEHSSYCLLHYRNPIKELPFVLWYNKSGEAIVALSSTGVVLIPVHRCLNDLSSRKFQLLVQSNRLKISGVKVINSLIFLF